jgi:serine/threonine protein kinase
MYEILTKGGHPVLGDDFKNDLKFSLEDYKKQMMKISINDVIVKENPHISQLAVKLLQNLLNVSPNQRYGAPRALKHPWITRDVNAKIPLNMFEEIQMSMRVYEKLKFAQRVALTMSILNDKIIKKSSNEFSEKNHRREKEKTKVFIDNFSDDEKEN